MLQGAKESAELVKPSQITEFQRERDSGKYFVFVNKTSSGVAFSNPIMGVLLEVTGEVSQTPCDACETLVHCLACIDQTFVEDILG